jgi:hypothetical protein
MLPHGLSYLFIWALGDETWTLNMCKFYKSIWIFFSFIFVVNMELEAWFVILHKQIDSIISYNMWKCIGEKVARKMCNLMYYIFGQQSRPILLEY